MKHQQNASSARKPSTPGLSGVNYLVRSATTNGVRSRVLSSATRSGHRGLTQTRSSPEYPGRFNPTAIDTGLLRVDQGE